MQVSEDVEYAILPDLHASYGLRQLNFRYSNVTVVHDVATYNSVAGQGDVA